MSKRNTLPMKPMLWLLVILLAIVYVIPWTAKNILTSAKPSMASPNNMTQSSGQANLQTPSASSGEESKENNISQQNNASQQNNPASEQTKNVNAANGQNPNSKSAQNTSAFGETGAAQAENNMLPAGNQTNAPMDIANPIPTDAQVAQNIGLQNANRNQLMTVLSAREALTAPVQEAAAASKYQIVTSQSIPTPYTGPVPADVIAKIKSNEVVASR